MKHDEFPDQGCAEGFSERDPAELADTDQHGSEAVPQTVQARSAEKPERSEARLRANRANALKSTGPKTAIGKANSRFNALKHGLTRKFLSKESGEFADPGLQQLAGALNQEYGQGGLAATLAMEAVLLDYWRLGKALELEISHVDRPAFFYQSGPCANLQRYIGSARRGLEKNLELLEKERASQSRGDEDHEGNDCEERSGERANNLEELDGQKA
jgi:hypothetical protein